MWRWLRLYWLVVLVSPFLVACGGDGGRPSPTGASVTQYMVITIDVEALPARQSEDHVQRLIHGNFPHSGRAGNVDMMDIADRHNVRLTFFLDVLEEVNYSKQIEAVAILISECGHDLQLHTHVEIMPDVFFARLGFERKDTSSFIETEASALLDETKRMAILSQEYSNVSMGKSDRRDSCFIYRTALVDPRSIR